MKVCDAPFSLDGQKLLKEQDDVRKEFDTMLKSKDYSKLTFKITKVVPFEEAEPKLRQRDKDMLKGIMGKADPIVYVQVNDKDSVLLMVRMRAERARIVGLAD